MQNVGCRRLFSLTDKRRLWRTNNIRDKITKAVKFLDVKIESTCTCSLKKKMYAPSTLVGRE